MIHTRMMSFLELPQCVTWAELLTGCKNRGRWPELRKSGARVWVSELGDIYVYLEVVMDYGRDVSACCNHWSCTWGRAPDQLQYIWGPVWGCHSASSPPRLFYHPPHWQPSANGRGCLGRTRPMPSQTSCSVTQSMPRQSCELSLMPLPKKKMWFGEEGDSQKEGKELSGMSLME